MTIMLNKLYSLLVSGRAGTSSIFAKRISPVWHTEKSERIHEILIPNTSAYTDKVQLLASVLCYEVLATQYGHEIRELDPNNTYAPVTRPATQPTNTPLDVYCIADLTQSQERLKALRAELDADILEKLVAPSWIEYMAAGCLQILRECA